jgi:hypothetical protein
MDEVKSIFKSKTFWFNVAVAVVGIASQVGSEQLSKLGINGIAQNWAMVTLGAFTTIGNIYLRSVTTEAVAMPPLKKK